MFDSGIYAILDCEALGLTTPRSIALGRKKIYKYAEAACEAGVVAIQLRAKNLPLQHRTSFDIAFDFNELLTPRIAFIFNDDVICGSRMLNGAHIGQTDTTPIAARAIMEAPRLLGLSTHNLEQVQRANVLPVDYVGFGPVRNTQWKRDPGPLTGLALLRDAAKYSIKPVVAIGGLGVEDMPLVRQAGAHAAAVIGAWLSGPKGLKTPQEAQQALQQLVAAWGA